MYYLKKINLSVICKLFLVIYIIYLIIIFLILGMFNFDTNFKLCESPDEDPLDFCAPVNCHMKYLGFRSLFEANKRQCMPIPICNRRMNNKNSSNIVISKKKYYFSIKPLYAEFMSKMIF